MIKKLRRYQKRILLLALIILFYFLIHPEYGTWQSDGRYYNAGGHWLWEQTYTWWYIFLLVDLVVYHLIVDPRCFPY